MSARAASFLFAAAVVAVSVLTPPLTSAAGATVQGNGVAPLMPVAMSAQRNVMRAD